jgi:hypothetical protein
MVNRVWQQHFGRGLVASSGDFGRQGERPTHPALLDWLASEWTARGFQMKPLHRLIMTSAAYRRASAPASDEMLARDADNAPYSRFARRRLSAEQLRDALLATSGELNLQMGGPGVLSELPKGLRSAYAWQPDADPAQRNRRSIYLLVRRNLREPLLEVFDMPDTHETCTRRMETTTAPQALFLWNAEWSLDRARALAARVEQTASADPERAIRAAYRLVFQRAAQPDEVASAARFLEQTGDAAAKPNSEAIVDLCHVLLNSNEFLFVD